MLFAARRRMEFGGLVVALAAFYVTLAIVDQLSAADGPRPAWTTSKITGTPTPPAPYTIRPAFPNLSFANPTSLEELPDGRMLVSEIDGNVFTFRKDSQTPERDLLLNLGGGKIWHATAGPSFGVKWQLYVCYSKDGTSYVSRFNISGTTADARSEEVILTWPAGGHNGGCLQFGTDGMLYISTGDGSGPNPPDGRTAAQDVSNLFGCVLRIDIRMKDKGKNYAVPADNPFVDLDGARPEIWAYGLRNPWKFGVDRKTGDIFAADNGWESWEMVHRIVRGGNCGWPIMEGRAVLRSEVTQGPTPIRPPVKDHSHTEANSVIGGPIYRGSKLPELDGTFIYGDYITGTIWGLQSDGKDSYTHQVLVDTDQRITAFTEGSAGELFVLDYDYTGQIYELIPSGLADKSANFPKLLSETGLFTTLKTMTPAPGVIPYDVVVERWIDGAKTKRWAAIPGSGSITLGKDRTAAIYPEGTVFAKQLTLPIGGTGRDKSPDIPLETQLLHYENGSWHTYSYLWNDQRSDAILIDAAGTDHEFRYALPVAVRGEGEVEQRSWHANAENECRMCHNAGSGFVLGFVPNQLNRAIRTSNENLQNQLDLLARQKVIAKASRPYDVRGKLVDPHDESQSLNERARSYLHGNCSSCHHPGGNAIVSFYLRRELPFNELKTNKGTGIGTFGLENAKLIVPGDPYRSVLLYRMSKLGYARMPYIGSRVVDSQGVALIEQWIGSMPHQMSDQDSAPVQPGSRDHKLLASLTAPVESPAFQEASQQKAVDSLVETTAGALALSAGIHGRSIRNIDTSHVYESTGSDIRGLFETFIPEKSRRKTLGRNVDPQTVLALTGSATRGRLIFYSDGARCRNCHDLNDAEKSTGPTLVEIRKKYPRRSEMLTHILKPSLKVDEKFATWSVVTDDGKINNGLLVSQNVDEVILKTAERKTIRIEKSRIDVMKKSPQSLMPQAILSDQTAQEAADLLAWFGAEDAN